MGGWISGVVLAASIPSGIYVAAAGERSGVARFAAPSGGTLTLTEAITASDLMIYSIDNANERWRLSATVPRLRDSVWPHLVLDQRVAAASSVGSDDRGASASFELDAVDAAAAAAHFSVPLHARSPLGEGLSATFSAGGWAAGGAQPVTMTIRNIGAPVDLVLGGRQRGPRDNRFSFTVYPAGSDEPLEAIVAHDFGGISGATRMVAGSEQAVTVDVSAWAAASAPGTYRVVCRYEGELWAPGAFATGPSSAHLQWDWVVEESITVTVP